MVAFLECLSYTSNHMINHDNYPILQSMLKVFPLFMVKLELENTEVIGVWIKCNNCNKCVHFKIPTSMSDDIIPVLSNPLVFIMMVSHR